MSARKRYDVVHEGSEWRLKHLGSTLYRGQIKQDVIDAGVREARRNTPSQLLIHRMDGTIEDERTYGDDPFPPRG
ncbi:DUF2188 domain-containing protein [Curtobacterium flaccumfaciens]|uniref:DUF2188 domain-containing protein n=1 Tax=Curtobacterium flaccumfaciens TaxID=2035 RepID=UPI00220F139D|nr:DUF2188 domain-containing protein [Curtobacterium flaccumfaciens]UWD79254.1 DUF2188 domain-containing protein [Curtobacterium flaccumfaciens]